MESEVGGPTEAVGRLRSAWISGSRGWCSTYHSLGRSAAPKIKKQAGKVVSGLLKYHITECLDSEVFLDSGNLHVGAGICCVVVVGRRHFVVNLDVEFDFGLSSRRTD